MLERLRIENYALIDQLDIEFGEGLNVLTGSTGAGKSIIVGAIGLVTGGRGSEEIVRTGKDRTVIEARFKPGDGKGIEADSDEEKYLSENGALVLRREYIRSGGGKGYIGKKPVSLVILRDFSKRLVSILGQHSHQALLDSSNHIRYLDSYAGIEADLGNLHVLYNNARSLKDDLAHARRNEREISDKLELLNFQINEIRSANLSPGEDDELKTEKQILENSLRLKEIGGKAISVLLESDDSVIEKIGETARELRSIKIENRESEEILGLITSASDSINESALRIRNFLDNIDDNPERLEEINGRLQEIYRLKKKYQTDIGGIIEYLESCERELARFKSKSSGPEEIEKNLIRAVNSLNALAVELSEKRRNAAVSLENSLLETLKEVGMSNAQFKIGFSSREDPEGLYSIDGRHLYGDISGFDLVEFLFCPNPGEGLKPLTKIASGGEISRVMLALKNAFLRGETEKCEIFDEIDTGISGDVAEKVARQLKKLSRTQQVICITHLHQIASAADHHFKVFKKRVKGRSITLVKRLDHENRVKEIASLISGKNISEKALDGAREMLNNGRAE